MTVTFSTLRVKPRRPAGYVRTNGMSPRRNGPADGWLSGQGGPLAWNDPRVNGDAPVWWIGADGARGVDWAAYGAQGLATADVIPAVARATALVVGPVVRTPWRYTRVAPGNATELRQGEEALPRPAWAVDPHLVGTLPGGPGNRPLLPRTHRQSPHAFWRGLVKDALWFGATLLMYALDADGQPLTGTLRYAHPGAWDIDNDTGEILLAPGTNLELQSDQDGVFHLGPVTWATRIMHGLPSGGALTSSGLLLQTATQLTGYLSKAGTPSGILKVTTPNFGDENALNLKTKWIEAHGGIERSVAVLNAAVDYSPVQISAVDADVVRAKNATLLDLAHAFNLPAWALDASVGGTSLQYSSQRDRRADLVDLTLADLGRNLEDLLTSILPYGTAMRIDWSQFTEDTASLMPFFESGLTNGYLTVNEVRDRLRLPGIERTTDAEETA